MPAVMKTPGVYIIEESAFPSSVVEVATAVPAFIGFTEKADNKGKSLSKMPWRITSLAEYHTYFGGAPHPIFSLGEDTGATARPGGRRSVRTVAATDAAGFSFAGTAYKLTPPSNQFLLYYSMNLFFQNGGGSCYIVSVGSYSDDIEAETLQNAIPLLIKEQEPTMLVIPEAVRLSDTECITLQQAMLAHCGAVMKNRFAVLDIYRGFKDRQDLGGDPVDAFRSALGVNNLDFAAAYYPWLNTTIVGTTDVSFDNISVDSLPTLQTILRLELNLPADGSDGEGRAKAASDAVNDLTKDWTAVPDGATDPPTADDISAGKALLDKVLTGLSPQLYGAALGQIKDELNLLPPAAAMAGVYTAVDNSRGVWKAPANVSLNAVVSPSVNITHDDQEELNVTVMGKSINAIRPFIGEGVLVWGGRTLDGNSLDWRYIQVRRTMIMLEESIRLAAKAYVFENNNANTWVTVKSTIRNFLTGIWKRGGLAGGSPDDAFAVFVGLGETMTPEDILEGIMRVTVLVAITRPAEFIEITFQQQMQQS
ncbi:MAG: phage tail sheath family protein [Chloroflexi bacterium]|nr:phage tail sheath family protein [Chloroflexota bacterium]